MEVNGMFKSLDKKRATNPKPGNQTLLVSTAAKVLCNC